MYYNVLTMPRRGHLPVLMLWLSVLLYTIQYQIQNLLLVLLVLNSRGFSYINYPHKVCQAIKGGRGERGVGTGLTWIKIEPCRSGELRSISSIGLATLFTDASIVFRQHEARLMGSLTRTYELKQTCQYA
jgi:hypothetical protein